MTPWCSLCVQPAQSRVKLKPRRIHPLRFAFVVCFADQLFVRRSFCGNSRPQEADTLKSLEEAIEKLEKADRAFPSIVFSHGDLVKPIHLPPFPPFPAGVWFVVLSSTTTRLLHLFIYLCTPKLPWKLLSPIVHSYTHICAHTCTHVQDMHACIHIYTCMHA